MSTTQTTPTSPVIQLTQSAADQVRTMQMEQPEHAGKPLRVYIENGGCSGLQYGMLFDEIRADDRQLEFFGVTVLIDPLSADYLRGSTIDFSDALTGGGFKVINPNAKTSCGCGKSFEA